jgi:hypothetical protein
VMKAVGLRAAVEVVELSTSRVQVVVAEKMGVQGASDRVSPVPF